MARTVELTSPPAAVAVPLPAPAAVEDPSVAAESWVSRLLRRGALASGALFLASLTLELLPDHERQSVAIAVLRKAALGTLLLTPVVRLLTSGAALAWRGERRYAVYAAGVVALLGVAVSRGFSH